jgi:hypothetical protein
MIGLYLPDLTFENLFRINSSKVLHKSSKDVAKAFGIRIFFISRFTVRVMFDGGHVHEDKSLLLINFLPRQVAQQRIRKTGP